MQLTEQQQTIVAHNYGAARVFAVAGAGKTTAMVHRINRLVAEGIFAPEKILATSFSRASVRDIEEALQQWPRCGNVKTRTLHQVGNYILKLALKRGYILPARQPIDPGDEKFILFQTLKEARKRHKELRSQLDDLDQDDFLAYVGQWKGNLHYADLKQAQLPASALRVAQQAEPPEEFEFYLLLYGLFEEVRQRNCWFTYDDMLMTGWELLVKHEDLLNYLRKQVDCVIVDEFQDINLAQFEILHLLTVSHGNYMVIGDDDQTIYEWRGANSRFILKEFQQRYQARTYLISDNFRCPASPLILANQVIAHNHQRHPKKLSLTKGFRGQTFVHQEAGLADLGAGVVKEIKRVLAQGTDPREIAILVRVQAQTPYIEQNLIQENISYRGLTPFYQRTEIANFLSFCYLLKIEKQLNQGLPLTEVEQQEFTKAWNQAQKVPPLRYLTREQKHWVWEKVIRENYSLTASIQWLQAGANNSYSAKKLTNLVPWFLIAAAKEPAVKVLLELDRILGYRRYLKNSSGFAETGEGKAAGVTAFLNYAAAKGTIIDLLVHLEEIAREREIQKQQPDIRAICLTTIHQAKGLEWEVVCIPNCNQGYLPFGEIRLKERLEEERRLLYVALTRAKKELHLHLDKEKPVSQFLQEANYSQTLQIVQRLETTLASNPETWQTKDILPLVRYTHTFNLKRYFTHWWDKQQPQQQLIAQTMHSFFLSIEQQQLWRKLKLEAAYLNFWQDLILNPKPEIREFDLQEFINIQTQKPPQPNLQRRIQPGHRVEHTRFGPGEVTQVVQEMSADIVTVDFENHGRKRIKISPEMCHLNLI